MARTKLSVIRVGQLHLPVVLLHGVSAQLADDPRVRFQPHIQGANVLVADLVQRVGPLALPAVTTPLVVLTRDGDDDAATLTRTRGAVPVEITGTKQMLVDAIVQAHRATTPAGQVPDALSDDEVWLSPREFQILTAICRGASNIDIARELYLSPNSIKTYIRTAYRRIGVTTRSQAIIWGLERGYGSRG